MSERSVCCVDSCWRASAVEGGGGEQEYNRKYPVQSGVWVVDSREEHYGGLCTSKCVIGIYLFTRGFGPLASLVNSTGGLQSFSSLFSLPFHPPYGPFLKALWLLACYYPLWSSEALRTNLSCASSEPLALVNFLWLLMFPCIGIYFHYLHNECQHGVNFSDVRKKSGFTLINIDQSIQWLMCSLCW
jgi:hypothetical protein